jgi:hypothetical protein
VAACVEHKAAIEPGHVGDFAVEHRLIELGHLQPKRTGSPHQQPRSPKPSLWARTHRSTRKHWRLSLPRTSVRPEAANDGKIGTVNVGFLPLIYKGQFSLVSAISVREHSDLVLRGSLKHTSFFPPRLRQLHRSSQSARSSGFRLTFILAACWSFATALPLSAECQPQPTAMPPWGEEESGLYSLFVPTRTRRPSGLLSLGGR